MDYNSWRKKVSKELGEAGFALVDLPNWDWKGAYAEGYTPKQAADEALREVVYMNEGDEDFWDYMSVSDVDPGL